MGYVCVCVLLCLFVSVLFVHCPSITKLSHKGYEKESYQEKNVIFRVIFSCDRWDVGVNISSCVGDFIHFTHVQ